jgi:hypothetical protein
VAFIHSTFTINRDISRPSSVLANPRFFLPHANDHLFHFRRKSRTYSYPHSTDDSNSHERTVTLLEARSVISSSGTTGLRTWEAALLLGFYLVSETGRASIHGKRLFELGAGTGMLSILCAKHLGVAGVVATDGDEAVVDAIKTNLFLLMTQPGVKFGLRLSSGVTVLTERHSQKTTAWQCQILWSVRTS